VHFLLSQSCRSLKNVSLVGPHIPFLGLIKRSYDGWLKMRASSEGPFFSLASSPPNPRSTTGYSIFIVDLNFLQYQVFTSLSKTVQKQHRFGGWFCATQAIGKLILRTGQMHSLHQVRLYSIMLSTQNYCLR